MGMPFNLLFKTTEIVSIKNNSYLGIQFLQVIGIGKRPLLVFTPRWQGPRPVGCAAAVFVRAIATTARGAVIYHCIKETFYGEKKKQIVPFIKKSKFKLNNVVGCGPESESRIVSK